MTRRSGTVAAVLALVAAAATVALLAHRRQEGVRTAPTPPTGRPSVDVAYAARPSEKADDPAAAGWDSEVFHDQASAQLGLLAHALEQQNPGEAELAPLLAPDFRCDALRPGPRAEAFRDPSLTVTRAAEDPAPRTDGAVGRFPGAAGLLAQLRELAAPLAGASDVHAKFKIYRIEVTAASVATVANVQLRGAGPAGAVQITATWQIRFRRSPGGPPTIEWIHVSDHEESVAKSPLFSDRTAAVLGRNSSWKEQLRIGTDYWLERLDASFAPFIYGTQGLAIGDVNGDGLEDLYVCQTGGLPNRLLVQQPDGTALDQSAAAGVDLLDRSTAALLIDLDDDGDEDLVVATDAGIVLFANDGAGHFTRKEKLRASGVMSLAAADFDLDGDLDVYACVYFGDGAKTTDLPRPAPFFDANNGGANILFRNDGAFKLSDVTRAVGLDQNNRKWSFSATWEDYDDDGDPDLFVANDFGRKNLYRNDHGHFTDVAAAAGVEDIGSGMSASFGDYDEDGRMDLYVGNMWSSAGGRISTQDRFHAGVAQGTRAQLQRFAKGNSLFHNQGDGTFRDVSAAAGVELGRWAWGSIFTDLNNDGREDLVVVNGFLTRPGKPDL